MHVRRSTSLLALPLVALVALAACGSDSKDSGDTTATTAAASTTAAGPTTTGGTASTSAGGSSTTASAGSTPSTGATGDVSLAGICPDTVSIQTDWNPEAEHGWLYELIGDGYTVDTGKFTVTGPLMAGGTDTGVKIQIRSGGPAIGYQTVTSQMYADDSILLGFVYTDEGIQNSAKQPTIAVESGMDKNPQMIMWDPATYPDVTDIAGLGKDKVKIRYFSGAAYMDFFTATGVLSKDQVDGSYDGTPALFVADEGKSAQQGFASAEPYLYENEIAGWMKPVKYAYINDAGWDNYAQSIATKPENVTKYAECLKKLVPMIQQSTVDYLADPTHANGIVLDAVQKFNNGWTYTQGTADYAVKTMKADGLLANGPDGVVGKFDMDRVTDLIAKATPIYTALDSAPKDGLKAEDIVTNEFLDPSIGIS